MEGGRREEGGGRTGGERGRERLCCVVLYCVWSVADRLIDLLSDPLEVVGHGHTDVLKHRRTTQRISMANDQ